MRTLASERTVFITCYFTDCLLIVFLTLLLFSHPVGCVVSCATIYHVWADDLKTKNVEKSKLVKMFSSARVSGVPIFS